jgi:hypothetical protein
VKWSLIKCTFLMICRRERSNDGGRLLVFSGVEWLAVQL